MIRKLERGDEGLVLAAADAVTGLGPRLWVDWKLSGEVPGLPHRFYLAGDTVLETAGPSAWLYGPVADGEELAAFLSFAGVDTLTTPGWRPPGWQVAPFVVMLWDGAGIDAEEPLPGFVESPPPGEIMALLAVDGTLPPGDVYDRFYADLCIRLNRGYALAFGVREAGTLIATAGAYSLTPNEVYISGVETHPAARGRGKAAALVRRLCVRFADRRVSLTCKPGLAPYYEKLGFKMLAGQTVRATKPAKETP